MVKPPPPHWFFSSSKAFSAGIYLLEGTVCTRWGPELENEVVSRAGDFLFIPPALPTKPSA